jgi:hypothetical protein
VRALVVEYDASGDGLISRAEFEDIVASNDHIRFAANLAGAVTIDASRNNDLASSSPRPSK